MTREHFLKLSCAGILGTIDHAANLFPDKENYLVSAVCIFAVPFDGDGKNGDRSYVDVFVDIECYDNLYAGHGGFPDRTDIREDSYREMPVIFSNSENQKIFFDGVNNVHVRIFGHKPDLSGLNHDEWDLRWQLVLNFKKGQVLATPYFPNVDFDFGLSQRLINDGPNQIYFERSALNNSRAINPGVRITRN